MQNMAWKQGLKRGTLTDLLSRSGTVVAMLLEEYDAEEVMKYREKEAAKRAANKILIRVGKLSKILLAQKKYDELEKAADDMSYLRELFDKYGI